MVSVVILAADVERRSVGTQSLMPDGLANLLSDRQQFLDLTTKADQCHETARGVEINEEVDVARLGVLAASDASEHPEVGGASLCGREVHLPAVPPDPLAV